MAALVVYQRAADRRRREAYERFCLERGLAFRREQPGEERRHAARTGPHGARCGLRSGRGAGCRRRRLRRQTIRPERALRAASRAAAARLRPRRAGACVGRCRARPGYPRDAVQRRAAGAVAPRVRAAGGPAHAPRNDPVARATRGQALRLERSDRKQRGRSPHPLAAQETRRRVHTQRPRRRLDGRAAGDTAVSAAGPPQGANCGPAFGGSAGVH